MIRWCSWFVGVLAWVIFPWAVKAVENESLPSWQGQENEGTELLLGGGLWPSSALPNRDPGIAGQAEARFKETRVKPTGEVSLIPTEDLGLAEIKAEVSDQLPAIAGELRDRFFKDVPSSFVIDPQRLLTEQKANDIHRFLEFHAEEAETPIYAIILGKDQKLPGDVDLAERHGKWFGSQSAVLMSYHLEKPDTIHLVFPREIQNRLPGSILSRIRESCFREGSVADNASDQVEKIVVELSIQLYWMQSLLERHRNFSEIQNSVPEEEPPAEFVTVPAAVADPLPPFSENQAIEEADLPKEEVVPVEVDSPVELSSALNPGGNEELIPAESAPVPLEIEPAEAPVQFSPQKIRFFILVGGLLLLGILGFIFAAMIQRYRDQAQKPVLFPSSHYQSRLGGEFAGGAFVGVSFELGNFDGAL